MKHDFVSILKGAFGLVRSSLDASPHGFPDLPHRCRNKVRTCNRTGASNKELTCVSLDSVQTHDEVDIVCQEAQVLYDPAMSSSRVTRERQVGRELA